MKNYTTNSKYNVKKSQKEMMEIRNTMEITPEILDKYVKKALNSKEGKNLVDPNYMFHRLLFCGDYEKINVSMLDLYKIHTQIAALVEFFICRDIYIEQMDIPREDLHIKAYDTINVKSADMKFQIKVIRCKIGGLFTNISNDIRSIHNNKKSHTFKILRCLGLTPNEIRSFGIKTYSTTYSVSHIQSILDNEIEDYKKFMSKKLNNVYEIIQIDGKWFNTDGVKSSKQPVVTVIGITKSGFKRVIALVTVDSESTEYIEEILLQLKARGVKTPKLIICDCSPSITSAIGNIYPEAELQHCYFHVAASLRRLTVNKIDGQIMSKLTQDIFNSRSLEQVQKRIQLMISNFPELEFGILMILSNKYIFTFMAFHSSLSKYVRTNNLVEGFNQKISIQLSHSKYFKSRDSLHAALISRIRDFNQLTNNKIPIDIMQHLEFADLSVISGISEITEEFLMYANEYTHFTMQRASGTTHYYVEKSKTQTIGDLLVTESYKVKTST